jgi:hypothetical protein
MDLKILLLISALVCGFYFGYEQGAKKYEILITELNETHTKVLTKQIEQAEFYRKLSNEHYQSYKNALNRDPVHTVERVFVKVASAKCEPVPNNSTGDVGAGDAEYRAELHKDTVRRITAVTHKAENDLLSCQIALKSLRDKILIHNENLRAKDGK